MLTWIFLAGLKTESLKAESEVTIYNQNFALIKESRSIELKKGQQKVTVSDVPVEIERESVGIRALDGRSPFTVLEQNFQYDLVSTYEILIRSVGKQITLNRVLPNGKTEKIHGRLLGAPT